METSSDESSSDVSSGSSQFSTDSSLKSSGLPLKRKAESSLNPTSSPKRLKVREVEKYRRFFNESLPEVVQREDGSKQRLHSPSSNSTRSRMSWSADEKDRFFFALERKGRHDNKGIASIVITRSEPEVRAFVQVLHSTATSHDYSSLHRRGLFDMSSIEAAVDITPTCEDAVEVAADTLAAQQFAQEEAAEKALHPSFWHITRKTARWTKRCLDANAKGRGEEGMSVLAKELPFATLLNISHFLDLSKHLYMNSKNPECNWRKIRKMRISNAASPSAFHSAFDELHAIVLAKTRRLVQLSLFLAQSRIDAESESSSPSRVVRAGDVSAAVEIARMPVNSQGHWLGVARRCNLRVYDNVNSRQYWGRRYSYDEVEDTLRNTGHTRRYWSRGRSGDEKDAESEERSEQDPSETEEVTSSGSESSTESTSSVGSDRNDHELQERPIIPQDSLTRRHERQNQAQEAYMEYKDSCHSRDENKKLWKVLGRDVEEDRDDGEVLKRPLPPGKRKEDFTDWLDWIEYWDEWERPNGMVFDEHFEMWRAKRKKEQLVIEDEDEDGGSSDHNDDDEDEKAHQTDTEILAHNTVEDSEDGDEGESFVEYQSEEESGTSSSTATSSDEVADSED